MTYGVSQKRREALKLLGISESDWMFVQGRYELTRHELTVLRTSIRRVAQATGDAKLIAAIPAGDEFNSQPYDERGWNSLCEALSYWACDKATST